MLENAHRNATLGNVIKVAWRRWKMHVTMWQWKIFVIMRRRVKIVRWLKEITNILKIIY
jgi:hypothetical protein